MATTKKNFITEDLDFAEAVAASYKQFLDENPYAEIKDRKEMQMTKTGGSFFAVVQNEEAIRKSHRDTLKDYVAILATIDSLREREESKLEARGNQEVGGKMAREFGMKS